MAVTGAELRLMLVVTYRNKGERLQAPFPFIELQYDAKNVAEQIAANVASVLNGKPAKELISEPHLVDPFAEDPETLVSADNNSGTGRLKEVL